MNDCFVKHFLRCALILVLGSYGVVHASQPSLLFISGSHSNGAKVKLLKKESLAYDFTIESLSASALAEQSDIAELFSKYSLLVFDGVSQRDNQQSFTQFIPVLKQSNTAAMAMVGNDANLLQNIDANKAQTISSYYQNGGKKNFERLLDYLKYRVFENNTTQEILPPIVYPSVGIYYPDYEGLVFSRREDYVKWLTNNRESAFQNSASQNSTVKNTAEDKPVIAVLIQRASIEVMQTALVDATIEKIEQRGAIALPFFFELSPFASDYTPLLIDSSTGDTAVDIIINYRMIHWANKRKAEFEQLGVPVLQGLSYFDGDKNKWEQDIQGVSPGMTPFTLVLPETAGVIDPLTVATLGSASGEASASMEDLELSEQVIDYQLDHMVEKAFRMVNLKYKKNIDKRLTVFVWGERDMGASFLNVPDSLHTLAHRLNAEDYQVEPYEHDWYSDKAKAILEPWYRDDRLGANIDELLADDLADLLPLNDYLAWFNQLPESVTKPVMDYWGHPKHSFMAVEKDGEHYLLMPRIHNGNMLVMRQPPRADDKDEAERLYHDETVPINHFYLAGYYFAREVWQSDAIVHYGTHGSQEYLYGKERVPSMYDHPHLAVWDTPVLYPFIVDDVGEAMQTKRRGRATVISHMTPPFAAAGLQTDLADTHNLMHEYSALDEGGVKVKTGQQIVDTCFENNICTDMELTREGIDADFPAFLDQLHEYMNELSGMSQPLGLHSFGELPRKELVISTVSQMLGSQFTQLAATFESKAYQAHIHDGSHTHGAHDAHNHERGSEHDHAHEGVHKDGGGDHGFHESAKEVSQLAGFKTVRDYVVAVVDHALATQGEQVNGVHQHGGDQYRDHEHDKHVHDEHEHEEHSHEGKEPPVAVTKLNKALQGFIEQGQQYYRDMLAIKELDNTVAFLNGQYIPVRTGGDPLRNPDALPTGYNLYGFDPSRIPTKAAYEQGAELVEQIIADYYSEHGRYPDKLAFSLWSIETMRQYGVLEAQALYAMGMRPVWSADGRVIDSEIIPYAELKRPRVDVVLSTTGLYRDAFPNIIQYLAKAIEKMADLKEEGNTIWQNSQRIAAALKAEGVDEAEADYLSSVRLFSNAPGQHGSGVDDATFASDSWEADSQISDIYLSRMGYYYGSDNSRYGKKIEGVNLYAKQLSGTDIALHSRSSNLYGMLSTDDPFEYFGALSLAVRNLDGKSPEMMISNLRDPNNNRAESAGSFMAKELRTRNFHPRWISEMMVEGYSGAVEMAGRIDNFWGWQVVDPNIVRADQWQSFFEVYVEDSLDLDIDEFFEEVNPNAQARMLERMLEAVRKDYWQADEKTLQRMVERYVEIVEQFDHYVDNEKLREYVDQTAVGFGLDLMLPVPEVPEASVMDNAAATEQVEGQKLEKVEAESSTQEFDWLMLTTSLVCLLVVGVGAYRQYWRSRT